MEKKKQEKRGSIKKVVLAGAVTSALLAIGLKKTLKKKKFDPLSYEKLSSMTVEELEKFKILLEQKIQKCSDKMQKGGAPIFFEETFEQIEKRSLLYKIIKLQDKLIRCQSLRTSKSS